MKHRKLTPEEQEFEDELKTQIRHVIRAMYLQRYAGRPGFKLEPVEVPDCVCEEILDLIAAAYFIAGDVPGPRNNREFREIVKKVVEPYLPGPPS
jgi:hypothetical protein